MTPSVSRPHGLLAPAITLLRCMRLSWQLLLVALVVALPLAWLMTSTVVIKLHDYETVQSEIGAAQGISALLDVAVLTQAHRGQTNLAMSGNAQAEQALKPLEEKLQAAIKATDDLIQSHSGWGLQAEWHPMQKTLTDFSHGHREADRTATFKAHTEQVAALGHLMRLLAERSGLAFLSDPQLSTLAELAVNRAIAYTEQTGLVRGQGAGLLARGQAEWAEMSLFLGRVALMKEQMLLAQRAGERLQSLGGPSIDGLSNAISRTQAFAQLAQDNFSTGQPKGDAQAFFQSGTQAIEAVRETTLSINKELMSGLNDQAAELQTEVVVTASVAVAVVLVLSYLGLAFFQSTLDALMRVRAVSSAGAQGDLTVRAQVDGRNEFALMGRELDAMTEKLAAVIQGIRGHAEGVAATGESLASTSQGLSDRMGNQAAAVEQSAATLEEVAQAVRSNASQVQQVDDLFRQMRESGEGGRNRMQHAVGTIEGIAATSREVGEIISVIDSLSFQTNILALNAAVEAARAGEAGRGFAVVAAEVRTLAQRSASAAGQIRQLITSSSEQVHQGVSEIHSARDGMGTIVTQVDGVGSAVNLIAQSTREQTDAVDQIAEAVRQIGDDTSYAAADVHKTSTSAHDLRQRADELMALVAQLKV
jgi:methyl-accepting chemotaxis protein